MIQFTDERKTTRAGAKALARAFSTVVANRFRGATVHRLSSFSQLFRCRWLFVRDRESDLIVPPESFRRCFPAHIAIDAGGVHVERSRHVAQVLSISVCHNAKSIRQRRDCVKFNGVVTVMRAMNEFLATGPFDLYELQLFHLVAEHQNFTKAGRAAGLTQSAITRQIRGMEDRLGVALFERTTRHVRLTPAGAALFARSGAILAEVNDAVSVLKDGFTLAPKTLRVGIGRTIGLAYLPGFFRQFQKRFPRVQLRVSHETSAFILAAVESGELDVGIVAAPPQLSRALTMTHRFTDEFLAIAPPKFRLSGATSRIRPSELPKLLARQRWLLISDETSTGKRLRAWLTRNEVNVDTTMEADNFDLIVNLVSLGLGVSIVPHRVLALHPKSRPVQRITIHPKFSRELIVVVRRQPEMSVPLKEFVANILF